MANIEIKGNATAEAELKFTPSGKAVLNLTVAENHRKKQGDQWVDDGATFYRVAAWDYLAEKFAGHIGKGQTVIINGAFRSGSFQGKDGEVKTYEVTAKEIGLVPKAEQSGGNFRGQQQSSGQSWGQEHAPTTPQSDPWAASNGQVEAPF